MYTRKDTPFNPVTLSFLDKELEAGFREDFFAGNISQYRMDLLLGCFLYAAFGFLDYWVIPEICTETWHIRFLAVCPTLLGIFFLTYWRHFSRFMNPAFFIAGFSAGAGIIAMIIKAPPPGNYLYYGGLLLCLLFYHRIRFFTSTILSWSIFLLYEIAAIYDVSTPRPALISNTFIFFSFIVTGMFMCYTLERHKRSDFLLRGAIMDRNNEIIAAYGEREREVQERKQAEEKNRRLEEQLYQSQKMEAVGQLAGGIAHEFNNILAAIIGYAGFLKVKMGENDPIRIYVEKITSCGNRAAGLTKDLLAFSRKQRITPHLMELNELLENAGPLLAMMVGEKVNLSVSRCGSQAWIQADAVLLEQVLLNLASNARDAMPEGGSLTIKCDMLETEDGLLPCHGMVKPGRYARITVEDNGKGMDEDTRTRIFEPFFTTKEVGKGTGLGLSMVYGVINQHNGFIDVSSKPDEGAVFRIYLPLAPPPALTATLNDGKQWNAFPEHEPAEHGFQTEHIP